MTVIFYFTIDKGTPGAHTKFLPNWSTFRQVKGTQSPGTLNKRVNLQEDNVSMTRHAQPLALATGMILGSKTHFRVCDTNSAQPKPHVP